MNGPPAGAGGNPVEDIFHAALELEPAKRAAFLDRACGGDARLRQRIAALLRAAEGNAGFLPEHPSRKNVERLAADAVIITERPGDRIGRYTLLEHIGTGGFGVVFKAQQEEPIRRLVALKIVKLGMDTREVIARFEAERQTLAMMDHPNIARVLDAGATETGRPYFVMELVNGLSITDYCNRHRLHTRERLALFAEVCRAIQHAHEKGIIHRDIKPSNVLVTLQDGTAIPKVIDFGIAKATAQSLAFNTVATALGVMGTPAYMSPEQADLTHADIDTRSDVYSLGVLLYELLAGEPPFRPGELFRMALDEVLRTIREEEPPRPSACLARLAVQKRSDVAQERATEPGKLTGLLRGDLDCIVMKCLEKDRARRYESASSLARDVQRHLRNEPITAQPPSAIYKLQKLVRRQRTVFAAAGAAFAVLLAAGIYWWFLPGTLSLDVSPEDAQLEVDGHEIQAGPMPRQIRLHAGAHQLRFHKVEFEDELRTVVVPRGGFAEVRRVTLNHQKGELDVDSYPPGTGIGLDDVDYHGAIRKRRVDTGPHELVGFADECFEKHLTLTLKQNERVDARISLEPGVMWKHRSTGIQGDFIVITNTPPGQPPVIVDDELNGPSFLSSVDGSNLARIGMPSGYLLRTLDLGGNAGRIITCSLEQKEIGPWLIAYQDRWPTNRLWAWKSPLKEDFEDSGTLSLEVLPRKGSGGDIALAGRDGLVHVLNGVTGEPEEPIQLAASALIEPPILAAWLQDGRTLLLALFKHGGTNDEPGAEMFQGALYDPTARRFLWRKEMGRWPQADKFDLSKERAPLIFFSGSNSWQVVDPLTGKAKSEGTTPGKGGFKCGWLNAGGTGACNLLFRFADPSKPIMAIRSADGTVIWSGPTNAAMSWFPSADGSCAHTRDGVMLLALNDRLTAVRSTTGKLLWEMPGKVRDLLVDEGAGDIYALFEDRRLFCLDSNGKNNWILRLEDETGPKAMLPDASSSHPGIILCRHASQIALAHWPRLLWTAMATGPLQATPQVVRDTNGRAVVVQLGPWGGFVSLAGLEGTNGRVLWSNNQYIAPNRAPAIGVMGDDGAMDIATIGGDDYSPERKLFVRRTVDGSVIRSPPCSLEGWFVGGIAADFRGIGRCDIAVSTWQGSREAPSPHITLIDSLTGGKLWEHLTQKANMGGLTAVDLDGDGIPDLVATSFDGYVYALRGKDGGLFWKTATNSYCSSVPPTVADLDDNGKLDVLITTEQPETPSNAPPGRLVVLDASHGDHLWSPDVPIDRRIAGRVTVADVDGHKMILAAMGTNGVVAFDWRSRKEKWRSPEGHPVITTPVVSDLAHNGTRQVVIAATTGDLLILDPATGKLLSKFKVATGPVEADPVIADLNGDGVDDILIASHDYRLYAVDGRSVFPKGSKVR